MKYVADCAKDAEYSRIAMGHEEPTRYLKKIQDRINELYDAGARTAGERYSQAWQQVYGSKEGYRTK